MLYEKEKYNIRNDDGLYCAGTSAVNETKARQYKASYHIGGIYNNLLLWFSHRMSETPAKMAKIILSYRPERCWQKEAAHLKIRCAAKLFYDMALDIYNSPWS